ncbi:hypothetical protein GCM10027160_09810 [Streptomyces calidiresistens]
MAVKVIHPAQAEDPEFRARFHREVKLSARVQGPCLLPLLAADPDAETPWLATAYAPGPTLHQHVTARGALTGGTLYAFAAGTARALAAIHATGVVHRDVKPQNVILAPDGPRVLDFGIARASDGTGVTRTGMITGTPGWISPEHYRTGTTGAEGDMFAWGALVAYAATGRLPFGTGAPDVVVHRVLSGKPDLDGIPEDLLPTVAEALAEDPRKRITAEAAAEKCSALLASRATVVLATDGESPPSDLGRFSEAQWDMPLVDDPPWHSAPAFRRGRVLALALTTLLLVAGIGGGALAFQPGGRTDDGDPLSARESSPTEVVDGPAAAPPSPDRPNGASDPDEPTVPPTGASATPVEEPGDTAYTRQGDPTEPHPEEWVASVPADHPSEREVEAAVRDHLAAILATKHTVPVDPVITFNRRAQTMMVTAEAVPQAPWEYQDLFRRAGAMAACTALNERLRDSPATWSYGRFVVQWHDFSAGAVPMILGFGEAETGCSTTIAGRWYGDEEGLFTARMPSADPREIRIADDLDREINSAWRTRVAHSPGLTPFILEDPIDLGFDPVQQAAYVWALDDGALMGRAQQSHFSETVENTLCPTLLAERRTNPAWGYTRWATVVDPLYDHAPVIIASGDCPENA